MKRIKKISIKKEKLIENSELINLKGGYGSGEHTVICKSMGVPLCEYQVDSCSSTQQLLELCQNLCDSGCDDISCT